MALALPRLGAPRRQFARQHPSVILIGLSSSFLGIAMATAPQHVTALASMDQDVSAWVEEVARLTQPDKIHWCEGSKAEFHALEGELIAAQQLLPLNSQSFPGCVLSRSHPLDVARVEHLTFVCTKDREDAGPNNHWLEPRQAHAQMNALFAGCMKGRTLYVVPYCMGPLNSP